MESYFDFVKILVTSGTLLVITTAARFSRFSLWFQDRSLSRLLSRFISGGNGSEIQFACRRGRFARRCMMRRGDRVVAREFAIEAHFR